jgi:hypothetical protein
LAEAKVATLGTHLGNDLLRRIHFQAWDFRQPFDRILVLAQLTRHLLVELADLLLDQLQVFERHLHPLALATFLHSRTSATLGEYFMPGGLHPITSFAALILETGRRISNGHRRRTRVMQRRGLQTLQPSLEESFGLTCFEFHEFDGDVQCGVVCSREAAEDYRRSAPENLSRNLIWCIS